MILNNAVRLNGLTGLAITKLDVLGGLEHIKVCTAYRYKGSVMDAFPSSLKVLAECEPVYEVVDGWEEDISGIAHFNRLPENVKKIPQAHRGTQGRAGADRFCWRAARRNDRAGKSFRLKTKSAKAKKVHMAGKDFLDFLEPIKYIQRSETGHGSVW